MKQHNTQATNTQLINIDSVYFKCEFENPTGSVKDRSLRYQISKIRELGFTSAVISSSGNAAISASVYCRQANIHLTVFVSHHIHPGKLNRLKKLGAVIIQSHKPVSEAMLFAAEKNAYNLRQSLDPNAVPGYRDISYELQKQLPDMDAIFIPVSSGTMFVGIKEGFDNNAKIAFHAVQTQAVHPISSQFDHDFSVLPRSIADGIVAKVTAREKHVISVIKSTKGFGWVVSDAAIKKTREYLQEKGIDTSYEGAAALAAVWKAKEKGFQYKKPVCILSGSYYND